jgi:hypothetical protein
MFHAGRAWVSPFDENSKALTTGSTEDHGGKSVSHDCQRLGEKCFSGATFPQRLEAASDSVLVAARVEEVAEKLLTEAVSMPQRLKPDSKQSLSRSAEALRHPKAGTSQSFSATSGTRALPDFFFVGDEPLSTQKRLAKCEFSAGNKKGRGG